MAETLIIKKLSHTLTLTQELYSSFSDENLKFNIPTTPSNTIGEQVWCIIGARESYLNALIKGQWSGFSCSLKNHEDKDSIIELLISTKSDIEDFLSKNQLSNNQIEILLSLFQHEVQHHGQLIRYVYSNKLKFPDSWNKQYTV